MRKELKISIALATFNGSKYLKQQLESFALQTRLPDELVVTDDRSNDSTLQIIEEFASTAPFSVRIHQNEFNLGYAKNFDRALNLCTGDLIFLSDQDDVWFKNKIGDVVAVAEDYPETLLFINDAELIKDDGSPLGLTQLGQTLSLGLNESRFTIGCCMAIRRDLLTIALPIPESSDSHDTWINKLSFFLNVRKIIKKVLQYYRRHEGNASSCIASSVVRRSRLDLNRVYISKNQRSYALYRVSQLAAMEDRLMNRYSSYLKVPLMEHRISKALGAIRSERAVVEARLMLLRHPRLYRWFFVIFFYLSRNYRYFSGWKSMLKDVFLK